MPHHEICGVALSIVAVLLAELETRHIGRRQERNFIAGRFERGPNQPLMLPGEAAEKNGDAVAFGRRKRPFHRTAKVRRSVARLILETSSLLRDALLDFQFDLLSRFQRFRQQGRLWFEARRSVHEASWAMRTQTVREMYTRCRVSRHEPSRQSDSYPFSGAERVCQRGASQLTAGVECDPPNSRRSTGPPA